MRRAALPVVLVVAAACDRGVVPVPTPARTIEVQVTPAARRALVFPRLFASGVPPFDLDVPPCIGRRRFTTDVDRLRPLDAGALTLFGLGRPLSLGTFATGYGESPDDMMRPLPVAPGDWIDVAATGGEDLPAFDLDGRVPRAPAGVTVPRTLRTGEPLALRWSGEGGERVRVTLLERELGRGAFYAFCDVPDRGRFTVPPEVTAGLVPGTAQLTVARGAVDITYTAGAPLALVILASTPVLPLAIEGAGGTDGAGSPGTSNR